MSCRRIFPISERPFFGHWLAGVLGCGLACSVAWAEEDPRLELARRALEEGVPTVAVQRLKTALEDPAVSTESRAQMMSLLAEALLADGHFDEAMQALPPASPEEDSATMAVRARLLVGTRQWQQALPLFHTLGRRPNPPAAVRLGEAECLQALGRPAAAVEVLEMADKKEPKSNAIRLRLASLLIDLEKGKRARAVLDSVKTSRNDESRWHRYLEGRLMLLEGRASEAMPLFDDMLSKTEGMNPHLLAGAALGSSEARIILHGYDIADKPLETFIWRYPESPWLETVFTRLDQIYAEQESPAEGELQKWAVKQPPRCAALARFYVSRMQMREKKLEKAEVSLLLFVKSYPAHPLLPYVHLMQADLLITKRDLPGAVRALEAAERKAANDLQRSEIQLRTGLVLYSQGQFLLAANEFQRAAEKSPRLRENASFNAALASLNQKNYDRFLSEYRALTAAFPDSSLRADLTLEKGLIQARDNDPRAEESLQLYLSHFPLNARQGEARLALAELAYERGELPAASSYLKTANRAANTEGTIEHGEYLGIFLAEEQNAKSEREVIERALAFLRKYPKSPLVPEVRMKLGQIYYRTSDFPAAETQFVTLARENPASPYAEAALFVAGQAAMQWIDSGAVDRALKLFDEVVQRDGVLKLHARQQQALVQAKLGKESEAVVLYEAILAAQPPPEPELRFAALAGKGDNLLILGRKKPEDLQAAIEVFDQLAKWPEVTPTWRNQALYKKARALEQLDRTPDALAVFYDVLEQDGATREEFFWYYKAGFDAARVFQDKEDWKEAIAIYDKMARVDGPRAAEAKARARELRLKHFIWD